MTFPVRTHAFSARSSTKESLQLLRREMPYLLWIPLYLLFFSLLEARPSSGTYWSTQLPADRYIPFCAWFVIPYCTWYFQMILTGTYLLRRDVPAFRRYMVFLALTFLSSEVLWTFFPNGQDLRPASPEGFLAPLVTLLYSIDTNTNVLPSLHVTGSIGAAFAMCDAAWKSNRRLCLMEIFLTVLISLSTVFIKQHSILDVAAAILFSAAAGLPVYHSTLHNRHTEMVLALPSTE